MGFDGIAIFLAMAFSAWIKFDSGIFSESVLISNSVIFSGALLSVPFWWLIFVVSGSYRLHWDLSWADELKLVVKPVTSGFIILFFGAFLVSPSASIGRWIIVFYYASLLLFVFIARGCMRVLERVLAKKGLLVRRAAIVGTGEAASNLESYLAENTALGYDMVGFVDPGKADSLVTVQQDRILGSVQDLHGIIRNYSIRELLVTIASNFHDDILSLLPRLDRSTPLFSVVDHASELEYLENPPPFANSLLSVEYRPL